MSTSSGASPSDFPPAWYPDPLGRHEHRWWDGAAWTDHVADAGRTGRDPVSTASVPSRASAADRQRGALGTWALAIAAIAILTWWVPYAGLVPATGAIVLGLTARRRASRSGDARDGTAVGAVVLGAVALALAGLVTSTTASIGAATLRSAISDYSACLESGTAPETCERRLQERLMDAALRSGTGSITPTSPST